MVFGATDYKKDSGHAYWGTPLVPTSFAGSNAVNGVVSGTAVSTFSGNNHRAGNDRFAHAVDQLQRGR